MARLKIKIDNFVTKSDQERIFSKRNIDLTFLALVFLLGAYLNWELTSVAALSLIMWFILNPISSGLLLKISLALTAVSPLLLIVKRGGRAEEIVNWAFLFLSLAAMAAIIEMISENPEREKLRKRDK